MATLVGYDAKSVMMATGVELGPPVGCVGYYPLE